MHAIAYRFDRTNFRFSAPHVRPRPPGSAHGESQRRRAGAAAGPRRLARADRGGLALVAIAGAVSGKGGRSEQPTSPRSAARSMRDDMPRLLAPPTCRTAGRTPPTWRRSSTWVGRGPPVRGGEGKRGRDDSAEGLLSGPRIVRTGPGQGCRNRAVSPDWTSQQARSPTSRHRQLPKQPRRSARPARCRRWRAEAAIAARSSTPPGRECAPMWRPRSTGWRRPQPMPGISLASIPPFAPTPNRRRSSQPIPTRNGLRRRALAAPLRDRARPRPGIGLRLARRERLAGSASSSATRGRPGTTATTAARALLGGGQHGRAGEGGGDGTLRGAPACPPSSPPGSGGAAARGRPLERLRRPARRPVDGGVELQPLRRLPGRRGGHSPVHSLDRGRLRPEDPFDPEEAIDAQAHLMSDLIRHLGSPAARPAAYNAGPAPVEACHCVPGDPRDDRLREPDPRPAWRGGRARDPRASK